MTNDSTKSSQPRKVSRSYLRRVLRLNPLVAPQAVLDTRREALGLKPVRGARPQVVANPRTQAQRQKVIAYVAKMQDDFWTLPLEQLRKSIDAIDVREFPELRPTVARMRMVAACRSEIPKLTTLPNADIGLVHAFKSAVVQPAKDAGPIRERFLQSVRDVGRWKKIRNMVKAIRKQYPAIYQLERDWFETILKLKKPVAVSHSGEEAYGGGEFEFEIPWRLLIIGGIVIIRILMSLAQ